MSETIKECTMTLLPAAPGTCPICATAHEPELPHNQQSLYYQMRHQMEHGRSATWADAMAHCSDEIKQFWVNALEERGIKVDADVGTTDGASKKAPAGVPSEQGAGTKDQLQDTVIPGRCQGNGY